MESGASEARPGGLTTALATAPFGSWRSSIAIEQLVAGVVSLREPLIDGDDLYWQEGRPSEGGRQVLVRASADGSVADVTPPGVSVRTRVHEYGGAACALDTGTVVYSDWADGRLYLQERGGAPSPLTPAGPFRYADIAMDRARGRLVCVREDHTDPGAVANELVAVSFDGSEGVEVLITGADFYSSPRLSPDGRRLAWLSWNHPNMPWDGTDLWLAGLDQDGRLGPPEHVAGSPTEWTAQPRWSPDGVLHFVNERTGWMNLYRRVEGGADPVDEGADGAAVEALAPLEGEFAHPDWVFGLGSYGVAGDGRIVAIVRRNGADELWSMAPDGGSPRRIRVPFTEMEWLQVRGSRAVFVAAGPTLETAVVTLDLDSGTFHVVRRSSEALLDPADLSAPEPIDFPTADGRTAHGLYYAPRNGRFVGPAGERPPLVVTSHAGPTAAARSGLSIGTQLFTSRGIAVLDVDYGGSTGYGRDYRQRLDGAWGIVDVEDCVNSAKALAESGLVDAERIAIRGGSASGYTTLCAITFHDAFRAGVSYYGIGDLAALAVDTHKFESHYTWRLVAPYPEAAALYRERSPAFFADRIRCPVLILQGLDDRVVPPAQARQMVAALAANHVPHAALFFEGEDHGFRTAENIVRSFAAELSFYGQVFGFTPADPIEPVVLER